MSLKRNENMAAEEIGFEMQENGAGAIFEEPLERPGTPMPQDIVPNPLDMFAQLSLNSALSAESNVLLEANESAMPPPPPPPPSTPVQHKLCCKPKESTSSSSLNSVTSLASAAAAAQPSAVSDDEDQHVPVLALKAALELTKAKIDAAAKQRRLSAGCNKVSQESRKLLKI